MERFWKLFHTVDRRIKLQRHVNLNITWNTLTDLINFSATVFDAALGNTSQRILTLKSTISPSLNMNMLFQGINSKSSSTCRSHHEKYLVFISIGIYKTISSTNRKCALLLKNTSRLCIQNTVLCHVSIFCYRVSFTNECYTRNVSGLHWLF